MNLVTLLGLVAGTLTTLAFLPQVIKTWRTKSTAGLSVGTFSMIGTGVSLWLVYGLLIGNLPIILTNSITLALVLTVLALMLIYRNRRAEGEKG